MTITKSTFIHNYCDINGGGAVDVGIRLSSIPPPTGNTILFENCMFQDNYAPIGGAVIVTVTTSDKRHHTGKNFITFERLL